MREAVQLLQRAVARPGVEAAAIVGTERRVLQARFDENLQPALEIAQACRQLFRETTPPLRLLQLRFTHANLLVLPAGGHVLLVRAEKGLDPTELRRQLDSALNALAESEAITHSRDATATGEQQPEAETGNPHPPSEAHDAGLRTGTSVDAPSGHALLLAVMEAAVGRARPLLGGPVLRNYLKRTRAPLLAAAPELEELDIDIDGGLDGDLRGEPSSLAPHMRRWVESFLERAARVVPEIAEVDVDDLLPEHATQLTALGFREADRRTA